MNAYLASQLLSHVVGHTKSLTCKRILTFLLVNEGDYNLLTKIRKFQAQRDTNDPVYKQMLHSAIVQVLEHLVSSINAFESGYTTKLVKKAIQETVCSDILSLPQVNQDLQALSEQGMQLPYTDLLFEKTTKLYLQLVRLSCVAKESFCGFSEPESVGRNL